MSDEVNLQPRYGRDLENAVEQVTPAIFRDHVTCTQLTIDRAGLVRGAMEIEYKEEVDNPAHDPLQIGVGVGPPTVIATWTIRYWWQSFYANALSSDIQFQAAGNLPAINVNSPFVGQRIAGWINGNKPQWDQFVSIGSPVQSGAFPPDLVTFTEYAATRFFNQTGTPLHVEVLFGPTFSWTGATIPPAGRQIWWVVTNQHFWEQFATNGPKCKLNSGAPFSIPQISIIKSAASPNWDTPSDVTNRVDYNAISSDSPNHFLISVVRGALAPNPLGQPL